MDFESYSLNQLNFDPEIAWVINLKDLFMAVFSKGLRTVLDDCGC